MTCVICKQSHTQPGKTTVTLERSGMTIVFKDVPAAVCANCGEAYIDDKTSSVLLKAAEEAVRAGVQVDIREFIGGNPQQGTLSRWLIPARYKMPSIQIRNLSEEAYSALKARAKADRRSIQQEAAWVLETMLSFHAGAHRPDWSRVDRMRELMARRYGVLPDSTPLIRQMRDER